MTSLAQLDPTQARQAIGPSLRMVSRADGRSRAAPPPGPRRDGRGPDVRRLVELVVRAALEVEVGRRTVAQLDGLLAPTVALELAHRQRRLAVQARRSRVALVGPEPGSLVRVIGQEPTEGTYEATALVRTSCHRITAIAVRAERYRGAWRIVAFSRPEDQAAAQPDRAE